MSQKSVSALHRALLAGVVCLSAFVASAALAKIEVADGQTYELATEDGVTTFSLNPPGFVLILR